MMLNSNSSRNNMPNMPNNDQASEYIAPLQPRRYNQVGHTHGNGNGNGDVHAAQREGGANATNSNFNFNFNLHQMYGGPQSDDDISLQDYGL